MNVFLVLVMLTATTPAQIPCVMIKPFIAAYGQEAVVGWARMHGYSDAQIVEVTRRCAKREYKK